MQAPVHPRTVPALMALTACTESPGVTEPEALPMQPPPVGFAKGDNAGLIAFADARESPGNTELHTVNPDGTAVSRVTIDGDLDTDPAWSRDGRRIAYTVRGGNLLTEAEIHIVGSDGTGDTNLPAGPGRERYPAWSPKGSNGGLLAFTSDLTGDEEIYILQIGQPGWTRLTFSSGADLMPSWSPDGKRIAFSSDRSGDQEIYVMNADGTGVAQLTKTGQASVRPAWSWRRNPKQRDPFRGGPGSAPGPPRPAW